MTLPGYDDALRTILDHVDALSSEDVPLAEAFGRVLRQDIVADRDQPPFDRAAMDGFAVRSGDVNRGARLDIVADIPAGGVAPVDADLTRGAARIATGAAVPPAYDAVIQKELARVEDGVVRFDIDACSPGNNVHPRGADAKRGERLLREGQRLAGPQLGIAAAVGCVRLRVACRPRVTLLTTGDEVLPPQVVTLQPQQIRNSNAPLLAGLLRQWRTPPMRHVHVPDDPNATLDAARGALADCDLVLTTGGVSAGERDYLPGAWRTLGAATVLHGVAIQPGRPLLVARAGGTLVVGLPGNPVSVLMTAILFVRPILRRMLGLDEALPWRPRKLLRDVRPHARRELFRAARLTDDDRLDVIDWHGSGDLAHTATMQGVARLPLQAGTVSAGTPLPYLSCMDDAP